LVFLESIGQEIYDDYDKPEIQDGYDVMKALRCDKIIISV